VKEHLEKSARERKLYAVIHGHFYQPPRENPWTESIELQKSAFPYHDWNERITHECYLPNSFAKIKDEKGKILSIVNNYSYLSFNFGPTLFSYLEKNFKEEYHKILEGDRISLKKNNGHGNALCQAYNHIILPLANHRDKVTQIRWGIVDFKYRFGRMPEGMWLPETAVNMEVVNVLVEEGIKFIVLSPYQARRIRPLNKKEWVDAREGKIDPKRAYRILLNSSGKRKERHLDVFFYDGYVAKSVAFEDLLISAKLFLEKIKRSFALEGDNQLFHIATDGETYGHHKVFGDLCLAYLVSYELPKNHIQIINYGHFLNLYPPEFEVEIEEGEKKKGSSWSCFHGVERWNSNCGCSTGGNPGWHQQWRKPLREALDILRDELAKFYEEVGSLYFHDIWEARNAYIGVMLNRNKVTISKFLKKHLKSEFSEKERVKALKLLEIQRNAMLMYTSCGWFFADISGIETIQNLKYSLKAMELAKELGKTDLEERFLALLKNAKSNLFLYKDGLEIYKKLVVPSKVTLERMVASYVILLLFNSNLSNTFYHYQLDRNDFFKRKLGVANISIGLIKITDGIIFETKKVIFFAIHLPDYIFQVYVKEIKDEENYHTLKSKVISAKNEDLLDGFKEIYTPLFEKRYYTLTDLLIDQREEVFSLLIKNEMDKLEIFYEDILEEYLFIAKEARRLEVSIPKDVKNELEASLNYKANKMINSLGNNFEESLFFQLQDTVKESQDLSLPLNYNTFQDKLQPLVLKKIIKLKKDFTLRNISQTKKMVEFIKSLGDVNWNYKIEDLIYELISKKAHEGKSMPIIDTFKELANLIGFNVEKIR